MKKYELVWLRKGQYSEYIEVTSVYAESKEAVFHAYKRQVTFGWLLEVR